VFRPLQEHPRSQNSPSGVGTKTVDFSRIDFGNTVDSVGSEIAIHGAGEEHGEFPHNVLVVDTRAASIEIGPAARKNLPDRGSC
jgi:hypothetical protein